MSRVSIKFIDNKTIDLTDLCLPDLKTLEILAIQYKYKSFNLYCDKTQNFNIDNYPYYLALYNFIYRKSIYKRIPECFSVFCYNDINIDKVYDLKPIYTERLIFVLALKLSSKRPKTFISKMRFYYNNNNEICDISDENVPMYFQIFDLIKKFIKHIQNNFRIEQISFRKKSNVQICTETFIMNKFLEFIEQDYEDVVVFLDKYFTKSRYEQFTRSLIIRYIMLHIVDISDKKTKEKNTRIVLIGN